MHPPERSVSFDSLQRFSDLFTTYVGNFQHLRSFYAFSPGDRTAWHQAGAAAASLPRDRKTLVDVLLEQNTSGGTDDAVEKNINKLARPDALAVVTGQQVGLFGGPMYTLYKTVTAIRLAADMEEELSVPVVPVFWLEGEDHDFDEAATVYVPDGTTLVEIKYAADQRDGTVNAGPVGRTLVDNRIDPVLSELKKHLPPTEFTDQINDILLGAYAKGVTFRDGFMRLMKALLPGTGLVFLSAEDLRLKRLAVPLFRKELEEFDESIARVVEASKRLATRYHSQVHVQPTNLFMITDQGRVSLEPENGKFHLKGLDRSFNPAELLEMLDRDPGRFSPNVVLRPLTQDLLLPTVAYVGGPAEVAYFGQYRGVYEWAGIPMPLIYPRASVTLVEPHTQRVMHRYGLTVPDFAGDFELLFKRVVLEAIDVDVEDIFGQAAGKLNEIIDAMRPTAESVDQTLVRSAEATRQSMLKELDRFKEKLIRAEKRHHDQIRSQLERAYGSLFPGGHLQERSLSIVYFLNKYGPQIINRLMNEIRLDPTSHQLIEV